MILLLLLTAFVRVSLQQDPVNDFCRRFGHQTAVIGRRLYIDGGQVNYNPISRYPSNYTNTNLLYNDLDDITGNGMPQLFANLSKSSYVPDVSGGILWADDVNKVFYQFGGEFQGMAQAFQMWLYDTVYNTWNMTQVTDSGIQRTSYGAGVTVNQTGVGYYYGGWQSNATTPGWTADPQISNSLIVYDMIGNAWLNNTGPDSIGRAEGVMVFLPASDGGLLIYFGGIQDAGNGTTTASNMSTIYIFDISSTKWYTQTATGDVPGNRRRFCAGATWPDDQSSYNIYLYGGAGMLTNTTGFDDVYILSLPTFTWIKWWPTEPGPGNPHNTLTCNVIDGSQMLIIGGTFPLTDNCDAPTDWGQHDLVLGENGPLHAMWDKFYPNVTTYEVPTAIVAKIGGSNFGGASKRQPQAWDNRDLPVYFTRQASFAARTATRDVPIPTAPANKNGNHGSSSHIGAIAGGVVGGILVLALLAILLCCCCRRVRRTETHRAELDHEPKPVPKATPQELATHRFSSMELSSVGKKDIVGASVSPTKSDDHSRPSDPTSPTHMIAAPTYGSIGSRYDPPPHLGAVHEDHTSRFPYEQRSPTSDGSLSPTGPHGALLNFPIANPFQVPQPTYRPQPYDPRTDPLHHEHFPPPSPSRSSHNNSTRPTTAQVHPNQPLTKPPFAGGT